MDTSVVLRSHARRPPAEDVAGQALTKAQMAIEAIALTLADDTRAQGPWLELAGDLLRCRGRYQQLRSAA